MWKRKGKHPLLGKDEWMGELFKNSQKGMQGEAVVWKTDVWGNMNILRDSIVSIRENSLCLRIANEMHLGIQRLPDCIKYYKGGQLWLMRGSQAHQMWRINNTGEQ